MRLTPAILRQLRHPHPITVKCWFCGTKARRRPHELVEWSTDWPLVSYGRCKARLNDWDEDLCEKHLFAKLDRRRVLRDLFRRERLGMNRASEYDL